MNSINCDYRTADLALATYLRVNGRRQKALEMLDRRSAVWVFDGSEEEFQDLILDYENQEAKVEPKEFITTVREVRDELYRFLKAQR